MNNLVVRIITGLFSGFLFLGTYFYSKNLFTILLIAIFCEILIFEWPRLAQFNKKLWLLVPVYPIVPVLSLIYLNHNYRSINILIPLYPFFVCWIADTFAYLFGVGFGKHKICPSISPKKSWEGLFGSFLGVIALNFLFFSRNLMLVVVVSILLALVSFAGDLFESYLKRRAGIKDSGAILPGHGGLLDRFDSVFFVSVVVVCFMRAFN
jgi:phosphatidate cytidylyltransferase